MFWVPAEPSGDEVWTRISLVMSILLFSPSYFYRHFRSVSSDLPVQTIINSVALYCLQVLDQICSFIQSVNTVKTMADEFHFPRKLTAVAQDLESQLKFYVYLH
jgi:hypothetical protein